MTAPRPFRAPHRRARARRGNSAFVKDPAFRVLFDAIDEALFIHELDTGLVLDVNQRMCAMYGYTYDEAVGLSVGDISVGGEFSNERAVQLVQDAAQSGPAVFEWHCHRKSGEPFWVEVNLRLIEVEGERYVLAAVTDISDRRATRKALEASEERYARIVKDLPDLVCRFRHDCTLTFVNEAFARYFDRLAESLLGTSFLALIPEEERQAVLDGLTALGEENPVVTSEHQVISGAGELRWQRWRNRALFDEDGEIVEFQSIGQDVTEQHRALEALRESEERFRQLAETIEEVFWLVEWPLRRVMYISPSFEQTWGRSCEELLGSMDVWRSSLHPDDLERTMAAIDEGGAVEYRIIRPDGTVRWIYDQAFPIRDEHGTIVRMAGIAQDITDRKRMEDELIRRCEIENLLLLELDHRVRNNLAALISMIDMTERGTHSTAEFAAAIRSRVSGMAAVHALLSKHNWTSIRLTDLVRALLPPAQHRALGFSGFDLAVPPRQASPLAVVLQELVTNSFKYGALRGDGGRIDLSCAVAEDGPDGRMLTLEWRESDGPPVVPPDEPGLGVRLIEGLVRSDLRGEAQLRFEPHGVHHTMRFRIGAADDRSIPPPGVAPGNPPS